MLPVGAKEEKGLWCMEMREGLKRQNLGETPETSSIPKNLGGSFRKMMVEPCQIKKHKREDLEQLPEPERVRK